jgi:hypothetical protein
MGSHNQQETKPSKKKKKKRKETKPSPNPQIEKQLTTGRVGKRTCSSTLLIPYP